MSGETEDDPDVGKHPNYIDVVVAEDEMFRVRRQYRLLSVTPNEANIDQLHGKIEVPAFDEELAADLRKIGDALDEEGWPRPYVPILVADNEIDWAYYPEPPSAERFALEEALGRATLGLYYIFRHADPLSVHYFYATIASVQLRILEDDNPDRRMYLAMILAEKMRRLHEHRLYLPAMRRKKKQVESLKADPGGNRAKHIHKQRSEAEAWKKAAREIAAKTTRKGGARDQHVQRELIKLGFPKRALRSIRRAVTEEENADE